jgi:hypothetical protein
MAGKKASVAKSEKIVVVRSLAGQYGGHWRSGRFWSNTGTDVPESEVTQAMREDSRITITEVVVEESSEEGGVQ